MLKINIQNIATLVGSALSLILIINEPVWGLILIIGLDSMVDILPNIPLLSSIIPLVGIITFVVFMLKQMKYRYLLKPIGAFNFILFYFFLFSVFIGQYAFDVPNIRNWVFTYIQLFFLVWLVVQIVNSKKDLNLLVSGIFGMFLFNSLLAIVDIIISLMTGGQFVRISGLSGNANTFALNGTIGLLLCMYYFNRFSGGRRILLYFLIGIFFTSIIYSGSRGGFVYLLISLLYVFYKFNFIKSKLFFTILPMLLLFYIVWQIIPASLEDRLLGTPQAILYGEDTWGFRIRLWEQGLKLWLKRPIFGVGNDGFVYNNPMGTKAVMHNMFLNILTQNGLFGFIPFLFILFSTFRNFVRLEKENKNDKEIKSLAIIFQAIFITLMLAGLKGNSEAKKILWIVIGLGITSKNIVFEKIKGWGEEGYYAK